MLRFISRLLHKDAQRTDARDSVPACEWRNTDDGLSFVLPEGSEDLFLSECLAAYQRLLLQQLAESGEASSDGSAIHVPSDILCRLDDNARDILNLPPVWPGSMEVRVRGITDRPDFSLELKLLLPGERSSCSYTLEGPFLRADGKLYLPDALQWTALQAVEKHRNIPSGTRKEADNLRLVYTLQQAKKKGLRIDLRRYERITVSMPKDVGVAILDSDSGDMNLVPDLGGGMLPEDVEARLGQLENGSATMRIGPSIVLLNERQLEAVHEILSVRHIPRKERKKFLECPTAFLNASLVNLENGFSLRMHGMEIFRKAYFGSRDESGCEWFEQGANTVLPLSAMADLISSEEGLEKLDQAVSKALRTGKEYTQFEDYIVALPASPDETGRRLDSVKKAVRARLAADQGIQSEPQVKITTAIDKHDDDVPDKIDAPESTPFYQGDLHKDDLLYTFKDYQEEGTRWILGLMEPLLSQKAGQPYLGGLLADDMGLGKTFMVLAALNVYLDRVRDSALDRPVLAVMPVVLLENWQQEIERVFRDDAPGPFRDIVVLQAGRDLAKFRRKSCRMNESRAYGRSDMPSLESGRYALTVGEHPAFLSEKEKGYWERLDIPGRLVLTNYETLRDYQFSLSLVRWSCVIFDEAQEIKNPNALKSRAAKALNADFRLAVTGTPVENSLKDFWSLFDTILPGALGSFQQFNRRYLYPISRAVSEAEKADLKMSLGRELRSRVGPFMLTRSKEEKLEGLPSKTVHDGGTDKACCAVMSGEQLERYNSVVASVLAVKKSGNAGRIKKVLLPSLRRLRDVSLHPALLEGEPRQCRSRSEAEAELRKSAKLALLLDILEEIRGRNEKVIIFVINKKLQLFLAYALGRLFQLDISIVNGDTPSVASAYRRGAATRIQLIRQFEHREGFQIICMSPLAAGVGLTVTGANNVIHLERHWNPAREAQATDRVYRIGATKDVHVYIPLLLHPELKSFDENLNELLQRKVLLKDAVVVNNAVQPDDFNAGAMFGDNVTASERVSAGWLDTMSRENFVALAAVVAGRTFGGKAAITTKKAAECGADVVVLCADYCVAVHCRLSRRPFAQAGAASQPHLAARVLEEHYGRPFRTAVLAVHAPSVEQDVLQEAKRLGTVVWDKAFFYEYLCQHEVLYSDLAAYLYDSRLCLSGDREEG